MTFHKTKSMMVILLLCIASSLVAGETEEYYYAIEQDDVVCGYAHVVIAQIDFDGQPAIQLIDSVWMKISALGKNIEGTYLFTYQIDPATGNYLFHTSNIDQGPTKLGGELTVDGDTIHIISYPGNDTTAVALSPDIVLQNTRLHKHLLDYFVADTLKENKCRVFSEIDGLINDVVYTKVGREQKVFAGTNYDALVVNALNRTTGIQVKMWVDATTGLLLRTDHPVRQAYLTDAGVVDKIQVADLNNKLFAKVDTVITNPWAISYLKVRAKLQPGGMWITPENLNVSGQSFTGTVEDNLIDGVFEISHKKYDGTNAPPFPPNFAKDESLREYLEPAEMIESDDSTLIRKAWELAEGSSDSWEAIKKLSRWVNTEIGYDLPGGVTALKTYETRLGECGSHANLLTAFCRAVGIPARGVFGCMYVPEHGGAFGQHAWNEVYMGEAGWIPIEATAEEVDYADCGHIRLGEWKSMAVMFNPIEMKIISYQLSEEATPDKGTEKYAPYIGEYQAEQNVITVLVQNGSLALNIPGQMIFELKDSDKNGDWFFKLTSRASVSFTSDSTGEINEMTICSRQRLPKDIASDSIEAILNVPEQYLPFIGAYTLPMQNVTFSIAFKDSMLTLGLPGNQAVGLHESETEGEWLCEIGTTSKLVIMFDTDESGNVTAMKYHELTACTKLSETDSE